MFLADKRFTYGHGLLLYNINPIYWPDSDTTLDAAQP